MVFSVVGDVGVNVIGDVVDVSTHVSLQVNIVNEHKLT